MQSVSSKIWTRIAVSISYDDNHYAMGTSTILLNTKSTIYLMLMNYIAWLCVKYQFKLICDENNLKER